MLRSFISVSSLRRFAATVAACVPLIASAAPTLIGDSVTVSASFNGGTSSSSATGVAGTDNLTVGCGCGFTTVFSPVFTSTTVSLGFNTDFPTNAWFFTGGSFFDVSGIDAVILVASISGGGSVTFTDHGFHVSLDDILLRNGDDLVVTLRLADGTTGTLPEPPMLAVLALALLASGAAARRRRG